MVLFLGVAYFAHDGLVFFFGGPVDLVVLINADLVDIGGNFDDFQAINFSEFPCLGHGRACHARKFRVEPEIVLERDRRQCLILVLDSNAFFRFQCLMQAF